MTKTKAQLEAELIAAKSEVIEWVMRYDKLAAALDAAYDELADEMQITLTAANTRVHRMGDRKPWKLIAIVAVVAFGLGLML